MNTDTILTVTNEDLKRLSPEEAVNFFRELLWAEAAKLGIPLTKINMSSWINVPDGGVDASVSDGDVPAQSGLIASGHNSYQIKVGSSFSPWQKARIGKELFGDKSPSKRNLGSRVKDCLDRNGMYVLICFGQDLTDGQRKQAVDNLWYYLEKCQYRTPRVDVWSLNNLLSFLRPFPSLALRVNHRDPARFETHRDWASHEEMRKEFIAGEAQEKLLLGLRTELRRNDGPVHIRVWGEPGVGKTRLVLEATDTDDLRPLVIYCSAQTFKDSNLMTEILRGEFFAVLVLDECDPASREYIWDRFKNHSPRIKLVSIYNEYDDTSGISYFDVPSLEEEQISSIIQAYGVPADRAHGWARECSGSPRVAHVIGWNLINHPEDLLKSPGTVRVWDRYIEGLDDPNSSEVMQRRLVLQHISLFKRFGYERAVVAEAKAIAELVQRANPQITWPRFQEIVKKLRDRKILQGESTLYITPKLLHVKLWIDWWETYGEGFEFDIIATLPPSLLDWFFQMFEYAEGSEVASRITRDLLGDNGPFQKNADLLQTRLGARFFRFLAEAEPGQALKCLKKTLGTWSKEDLLQFTTGRREVIWLLEGVARWKSLFADAARLLLALGEAENETWSNNASGVFSELFAISTHSRLSPTEASPQERFPVIKEALESDSKERRMLALRACSRALGPQLWGMVHEAHRVTSKEPELWVPKTYGELFDAYRQVWQYLFNTLDRLHTDERQEAINILLRNARSVGHFENLSSIVIETINELSQKPYVDRRQVLEAIIQILHYDGKSLPQKVRQSWEQLKNELAGTDFHSMMTRYVGMDILEDRFDEEGNPVDQAQPRIEELAQRAIENHVLLGQELDWLVSTEARNGYRFGYELGQRDEKYSLLPVILEAQKSVVANASVYFLGGYLRVMFEKNQQRWEELMDAFAEDEKLKTWVPELTWRSGMVSDRSALRVLKLIGGGVADIGHFQMLIYGRFTRELSEDVFKQWIEFLLSRPDARAVYIALDLYSHYYLGTDSKHRLPEELTLTLLTSPLLFQNSAVVNPDQMASYHWEQIGKAFVLLYPARALKLAEKMLEHFGEEGTILGGFYSRTQSVLMEITKLFPEETWTRIAKHLTPPLDSKAFYITQWLKGEDFWGEEREGGLSLIPVEAIWQWVNGDIDNRAWYLASFVPKTLFRKEGKICWAREVLVNYGEREDVRRNFRANFSTEGWTGSERLHLENKKQKLLEFREQEDNENVKMWIDEYLSQLERSIESAKVSEEREDF